MKRAFPAAALAMIIANPGLAADSTSTVSQTGDGNAASVSQNGTGGHSAYIEQIGTHGLVEIVQSGARAKAEIFIDGHDNAHFIDQAGDSANQLSLESNGTANLSIIHQQGYRDGANITSVVQSGTGNSTDVHQIAFAGAANEIALEQSGDNNSASLAQSGAGNRLSLIQHNHGNLAELSQSGTALALSITQNGGASIAVHQSN